MSAPATATLVLTRTSEWNSRFRRFRVIVDGCEIGWIKNGETTAFQIATGEHEVVVAIDWCSSNIHVTDAKPGEEVRLLCGHTFRPTQALRAATVMPDLYLFLMLEPDDDEPGTDG